jgi:hypothetical protein
LSGGVDNEGDARPPTAAGRPWPPAKGERFTLRVDAAMLESWRSFSREQGMTVSAFVLAAAEHYRVRTRLKQSTSSEQ